MENNYYERVLKRINDCNDIERQEYRRYRTDNGLIITKCDVHYLNVKVPLTDVEVDKLHIMIESKFNEKEELRRAEILKTL